MKKILTSNLKRVISYPLQSKTQKMVVHEIMILPGTNELDESQWEVLREDSHFLNHLNKRNFVPVSDEFPVENDAEDYPLERMTARDARELIKETENTPLLRKWRDVATRSTVISEIDKKLKEIDDARES